MEYIMTKCNRCNIEILDDALVCPLCRGVLQRNQDEDMRAQQDIDEDDIGMDEIEMYKSKSRMYPDVNPAMKKIKLVIKIFIFLSIVVEGVLILNNIW